MFLDVWQPWSLLLRVPCISYLDANGRRTHGKKLDMIVTVFYPSILGCVLTPIIMAANQDKMTLPSQLSGICCLFSVGILSSLGLMCLMLALKTQTPLLVGVIRNLEIVWAFILQYIVFGTVPSMLSVGGSLVIIAATVSASFWDTFVDIVKAKMQNASQSHSRRYEPQIDTKRPSFEI